MLPSITGQASTEPVSRSLYHESERLSNQHFIRLLELQPALLPTQIVCKLCTIELSDTIPGPKYEALSYTWGASSKNRRITIQVNDQSYQVCVTDNLYNALHRLRMCFQIRTLWVDAICINQADLKDKSLQVSRMGEIYKQAECVNVWLGEPDVTVWTIRRIVRRILTIATHLVLAPFWIIAFQAACERGDGPDFLHQTLDIAFLRPQYLEASLASSKPAWIDRVWIVQEFLLARKVFLCFAHFKILGDSWALYKLCYTEVHRHGSYKPPMPYTRYLVEGFSHIARLKDQVADRASAYSKPDLLSVLYATRLSRATQPVDKIWGIAGLIGSGEKADLRVDYTIPLAQAYVQATRASIKETGTLDILHLATGGRTAIEDLPTWAADFTQAGKKLEFAIHEDYGQWLKRPGLPGMPVVRTLDLLPPEEPRPARPLPRCWQPAASGAEDGLLRIKGVSLGTVETMHLVQRQVGERSDWPLAGYRNVEKYLELYTPVAEDLSSWLEHVKSRLFGTRDNSVTSTSAPNPTCLRSESVQPTSPKLELKVNFHDKNPYVPRQEFLWLGDRVSGLSVLLATCFKHWTSISSLVVKPKLSTVTHNPSNIVPDRSYSMPRPCTPYLDEAGRIACEGRPRRTGQRDVKPYPPEWMDTDTMRAHFACASQETDGVAALFATSAGFLGLGRADLLVGDEVVVVPGARVPVVIRSDGDGGRGSKEELFTFCGFAYTHGIMYGELLSMMVDLDGRDELEDLIEEFVLR